MTAFRLIPLPIHGVIEMLLGLVLMAAPFALGFGPAGLVTSVLIGAVLTGMAISNTAGERPELPISAHFAFDQAAVLGLLGATAFLGFDGDVPAAVTFLGAAATQFALNVTTRYSRPS